MDTSDVREHMSRMCISHHIISVHLSAIHTHTHAHRIKTLRCFVSLLLPRALFTKMMAVSLPSCSSSRSSERGFGLRRAARLKRSKREKRALSERLLL